MAFRKKCGAGETIGWAGLRKKGGRIEKKSPLLEEKLGVGGLIKGASGLKSPPGIQIKNSLTT